MVESSGPAGAKIRSRSRCYVRHPLWPDRMQTGTRGAAEWPQFEHIGLPCMQYICLYAYRVHSLNWIRRQPVQLKQT